MTYKSAYSWDQVFMEMAHTISKRSKDPSTKVGAILVSPDKQLITVGYNGFPTNFPDSIALWSNHDSDSNSDFGSITKYDIVIHAEINAILHAKCNLKNWTLYCTHPVCCRCMVCIIQAGITNVIFQDNQFSPSTALLKDIEKGFKIATIAKVNIKKMTGAKGCRTAIDVVP